MKRVIKASSDATTVHSMIEFLGAAGVDEHDVFMHFFDYLPSDECADVLLDFIAECDLEDEWERWAD